MEQDTYLRLSAQRALYGAVRPNLVRFTGEVRDKTIYLQWVILDRSSEDEVEDYRVVGTEILADYLDESIDEQFVRVTAPSDARDIPHLNNLFFCTKSVWSAD